jgi:hypothetical protein
MLLHYYYSRTISTTREDNTIRWQRERRTSKGQNVTTTMGLCIEINRPLQYKYPRKGIVIYCTMLGYLITNDHQLYRVTIFETPLGLVIRLLQSQSHVTSIIHNYFLRCATFTQLTSIHVRNYDHLLHSYTG